MREAGLAYNPPTDYVRVDPVEGKRIAVAYGRMKHRPSAADVKASYDAMIAETLAQYQWIKKTGLKIDFIAPGAEDPYGGNPRGAIMDVRENNHLWVFPTADGFGTLEAADKNHPMLAATDEVVGTHKLVANDVFRIVHDYFDN